MSLEMQRTLIKESNFNYWLHSGGRDNNQGELQTFTDKLPAIIEHAQNAVHLTLIEKKIVYDSHTAVTDINTMLRNWAARRSLFEEHLTSAQVHQAELNKSAVDRMWVQLQDLLLQLQTACGDKWGPWNTFMFHLNIAVENSRRRPRKSLKPREDVHGLLANLKDILLHDI